MDDHPWDNGTPKRNHSDEHKEMLDFCLISFLDLFFFFFLSVWSQYFYQLYCVAIPYLTSRGHWNPNPCFESCNWMNESHWLFVVKSRSKNLHEAEPVKGNAGGTMELQTLVASLKGFLMCVCVCVLAQSRSGNIESRCFKLLTTGCSSNV